MRLCVLTLLAVLASCTTQGSPTTTDTTPTDPVAVTADWLNAVANVEVETLAAIVEPTGLAVLAGVENQVRSDEMVGLLEQGLTDALATGYWQSFRDDFASIRGSSIGELTAGASQPIPGFANFTEVAISGPTGAAHVILRRSETAGWQVDMLATVGPSLADPIADYLASALEGENAVPVGEAYRSAVIPALDAAIAREPGNSALVFSTEFIRQLVGA